MRDHVLYRPVDFNVKETKATAASSSFGFSTPTLRCVYFSNI